MNLYERQFFYVFGYLESLSKIEGIDLKSEVCRVNKLVKDFFELENPFFVDINFDLDYYQNYLDQQYAEEARIEHENSCLGNEHKRSPYYNENLDYDQQSPEFWDHIS